MAEEGLSSTAWKYDLMAFSTIELVKSKDRSSANDMRVSHRLLRGRSFDIGARRRGRGVFDFNETI